MSTNTHRAIVTHASAATGDIRVRIPAKFGSDTALDISRVGRVATNGVWYVPNVGDQIVVTSDDDSFTNIFWVQVDRVVLDSTDLADQAITSLSISIDGASAVTTSATNSPTIGKDVTYTFTGVASNSNLQSLNNDLQSFKDASFLGIFR
jgi:hypothetical protein